MKRYLLGLFAVVLAIGFSSFNKAETKKMNTDYYFFQIATSNYLPANAVLKSDATFLEFGSVAPDGTGCTSTTKQCVSGFNANQVQLKSGETEIYELINNSQVPAVTPKRKS